MATVTTGYHRIGNVSSLAPGSVNMQAVPYATVTVTQTASGAAATIYSDAGMTVAITAGIVTADGNGNYDYYIPLNYPVTETISYISSDTTIAVQNVVANGPLVTSLTTTNASSDTVTLTGITSNCHVALCPTNSSAATMLTSAYVSAKNSGSITITHPTTAGATFDVIITPY